MSARVSCRSSRRATRCRPTRGRRSSSCAARARGSGTPRARSTSTSSPGSRSTTPATATRGSSTRSPSRRRGSAGVSNLFYSEPAMRLCRAARRVEPRRPRLPLQLGRRGERVRDQAGPQARPRARDRRPEIVVLDGAFHGRTLGALAATPRLAREDLFGPLPPGFVAVPRDDPDALRAAVGERTAAVMIEPIQGEAGIFPIADEVLVAAREACDAAGRGCSSSTRSSRGMGRTGIALGLRAAPRAPRPDHRGEGARRRPAGRRRASPRRSSRDVLERAATTARPSPAPRSPRRRRSRRST